MSQDQENALIVVLGAVGLPLACRVLAEWTPGDRFGTTMVVVMLVWVLYYTTWVVQRVRHAGPARRRGRAAGRPPAEHPSGTAPAPRTGVPDGTGRSERLPA